MNPNIKKTLIFWRAYGKFTTFVLFVLFLMMWCKTAKAETYQVVWILEYKYFDEQPAIVPLEEGPMEIEGGFCKMSSVHLSPAQPGEFRAMSCGPNREFDVVVSCNIDGEVGYLTSPDAAIMYPAINPKTFEKDFILAALRCFVLVAPDPKKKEII